MAGNNAKASLGRAGEVHARRFLEARGYQFVAANWHCAAGELDLVMRHDSELVFVEVKTRRGERSGRAEEAISPAKSRRILASADWFISEHVELQDLVWRCDIVAVTISPANGQVSIAHHINALVSG